MPQLNTPVSFASPAAPRQVISGRIGGNMQLLAAPPPIVATPTPTPPPATPAPPVMPANSLADAMAHITMDHANGTKHQPLHGMIPGSWQ